MINLSTAAFYDRATKQMGGLRSEAVKLQQQIGSEQRLSRSSEDPVAAARLRSLSRSERLADIDQTSSDRAMSDLRMADSALGSMADVLIRAKELATRAANDTLSESQLATIGQEVADLRQSLLSIANSRNSSGHALFGGQSAGQAYTEIGNAISYIGTGQTDAVELGEGQQVIPTLTGPEVFDIEVDGAATDMFVILGTLAGALQGGGAGLGDAARDALGGIDAGIDKVATSQTIVGSRMGWVELMDDRRTNNGELMADERQAVGGVDLAASISRLQDVMTVLEASQASFVKLSGLSLFNLLR